MANVNQLSQWNAAYNEFLNKNYAKALEVYEGISHLSRIAFNMGSIYCLLTDYENAIKCFTKSILSDEYQLVSLFQRGNLYFSMSVLDMAVQDYTRMLEILHDDCNYSQIGLEYKLYIAEVLFNRALCYLGLEEREKAQQDLIDAKSAAVLSIHYKSIEQVGFYSQIFMMKSGIQFTIPSYKTENLSAKTYLQNAKSIRGTESNFLGFIGSAPMLPKNVFFTGSRGKSVFRKSISAPGLSGLSNVSTNLEPAQVEPNQVESNQNELGEIYVPTLLDKTGTIQVNSKSLGFFKTREKAEEACKNYVCSSLGDNDAASNVDWFEKGWEYGGLQLYIQIQKIC